MPVSLPITEQKATFLNQIDVRDIKVVGTQDDYTVTNTSTWLGDLYLLLDDEARKDLGFLIDLYISTNSTANIIFFQIDGMRISSAPVTYGAAIPLMSPAGKFSLYAYNNSAGNVIMTYWLTYVPKCKFPFNKPIVGDFSNV